MNEAPASFTSVYRRHTPFSMVQYMTVIQGDTIRIEPKGDLLSYIYLTRTDLSTGLITAWDWSAITEFSWYIGGQLIDKQNINYIRYVFPNFMAKSQSKMQVDTINTLFLPLTFSFCHDMPLPLISMNYDKMDIRLKFSDSYDTTKFSYQCFINYIYLDEPERNWFALNKFEIPITQVQEIYDTKNISLSGPVKFIATPPTKIASDFEYRVMINGKPSREKGPYTGSELMFHSDYEMKYTSTSDMYPPAPIIDGSSFLDSPYGRGIYSVTATSSAPDFPPWNITDGTDTYWQSGIALAQDIVYTISASSNSENAWQAFSNSNVWISDKAYGSLARYEIKASSNVANAWSALSNTWISNPASYGTTVSMEFKSDATSNAANTWLAFSTNGAWVSDTSFFSDYAGQYANTASSNISNVIYCFDNNPQTNWTSNALYGYFINTGSFTATAVSNTVNAWRAFSKNGAWISDSKFGNFGQTLTINVSSSSGDVLNIFKSVDTKSDWVSNSSMNTYGFSSWYGVYNSLSSSNTTNAWLAYTPTTTWTSNGVYGNSFSGSYSINVSSQDTNNPDWYAVAADPNKQWTGTKFFGVSVPGGTSVIYASSNTGNAWKTTTTGWLSDAQFGNVITAPQTYISNASSNTGNAWQGFSTTGNWISNVAYFQPDLSVGTYANASSSGTIFPLIFGSSGTWKSSNTYGKFLQPGSYISNTNAGVTSNNLYVYSGNFIGTTNINTITTLANCTNEFFRTLPAGDYNTSASSNTGNAWRAFTSSGFEFNVDAYKNQGGSTLGVTVASSNTLNPTPTYTTSTPAVTPFVWTSSQNFSNTPGGQYYANAYTNNQDAYKAFTSTGTYTATGIDKFNGLIGTSNVNVQFPTAVTINSITSSLGDASTMNIQSSTNGTTWGKWATGTSNTYYKFSPIGTRTSTKAYTYTDIGISIIRYNNIQQDTTQTNIFKGTSSADFGGFVDGTITASSNQSDAWKIFSTTPTGTSWTPAATVSTSRTWSDGTTQTGDYITFRSTGINYNDSNVTINNPFNATIYRVVGSTNYKTSATLPSGSTCNEFGYFFPRTSTSTSSTKPTATYSTPTPKLLGQTSGLYTITAGDPIYSPSEGLTTITFTLNIPSVEIDHFDIYYYYVVQDRPYKVYPVGSTGTGPFLQYNNNGNFTIDGSSLSDDYSGNMTFGIQYDGDVHAVPTNNFMFNVYIKIKGISYLLESKNGLSYLSDQSGTTYIPIYPYFKNVSTGPTYSVEFTTTVSTTNVVKPIKIYFPNLDASADYDPYYMVTATATANFTQRILYTFTSSVKIVGFFIDSGSRTGYVNTFDLGLGGTRYTNIANRPFILTNLGRGLWKFLPAYQSDVRTISIDFNYINGTFVLCTFVPIFKFINNDDTFVGIYNDDVKYLNPITTNPYSITKLVIKDYVTNTSLYPTVLDTFYRDGTTINKFSTQDPKSNVTITISSTVNSVNFNKFYIYSPNLGTNTCKINYELKDENMSSLYSGGTSTITQTPTSFVNISYTGSGKTKFYLYVYGTSQTNFTSTDFDYNIVLYDTNNNGYIYKSSPAGFYLEYLPSPVTCLCPTSNLVEYTESSTNRRFNYFPRFTAYQTPLLTSGGYNLTSRTGTSVELYFDNGLSLNSILISGVYIQTTPICDFVIEDGPTFNNQVVSGKSTLTNSSVNPIVTFTSTQAPVRIRFTRLNQQTFDNILFINYITFTSTIVPTVAGVINTGAGWSYYSDTWSLGNIKMKNTANENLLAGVFTNANDPKVTSTTTGITKSAGKAIDTTIADLTFTFPNPGLTFTDVIVNTTNTGNITIKYLIGTTYTTWAKTPTTTSPPFTTTSIQIFFNDSNQSTVRVTDVVFSISGQTDIRLAIPTPGGAYTLSSDTNVSDSATGGLHKGEWFSYNLPFVATLKSASLQSRTINQYGIFSYQSDGMYYPIYRGGVSTTPPITTNQSSNIFRIVVFSTLTTTNSNSCDINSLSLTFANNLVLPAQTATNVFVLTSGLDVGIYDSSASANFTSVPKLLIKNSNNFTTNGDGFRGVYPDTTNPNGDKFMIYGNIYAPFTTTSSNQANISTMSSSLPITSFWVRKNGTLVASDAVATTSNTANINFAFNTGDIISFKALVSPAVGATSDLGFTLNYGSNIIPFNGVYFSGGPYQGYSSNLYTQIELPTPIKLGGYILDPGTANTWSLYGISGSTKTLLDSRTTNYIKKDYIITPPASSYSIYRLEVTETTGSNLYTRIESLVLKDSDQCIITKTLGPQPLTPIPNYQFGQYSISPTNARTVINETQPYTLATAGDATITINMPSTTTLKYVSAKGEFTSYKINGTGTYYKGFSTIATPITASIIILNFAGLLRLSNLILYNSVGRILPTTFTTGTDLITPITGDLERGIGGLSNIQLASATSNGEWVSLSSPLSNVYKYSISPTPISWDLVGYNGSTWGTIESIRNYTGTSTYSNALVNKITDIKYSNVALIVFESNIVQTTLATVNLYARNYTNVYSVGTVTAPSSSNLYIGVNYNSSVDSTTRTVSNSQSQFDVISKFDNPSRITKLSFRNQLVQGIQIDTPTGTSFINSLGSSTGAWSQYGNLYAHFTGSYTFSVGDTGSVQSGFSMTVGTTTQTTLPYTLVATARIWYPIRIYSPSALTITCTMPNNKTDLTNSLFPMQNLNYMYSTAPSTYTLSGLKPNETSYTQIIASTPIIADSVNVITVSDTNFYSELRLTLTKSTNSNITSFTDYRIYNEYGPINVPGALGGNAFSTPEWIQIQLPSAQVVYSYSFVSGASSWKLEGGSDGTSFPALLHSVTSYYKPENHFTIVPTPASYKFYKLTVTENSNSNLSIGYFKLFDSNRLYINPYMTSNTFSDPSTYRPGGLPGKYEFLSGPSTTDYSAVFDGVTTSRDVQNYSSPSSYTGSQTTKVSNNLVYGNWVQMKLPIGANASTFLMTYPQNGPNTFTFCGSYDGYNWLNCNTTTNFALTSVQTDVQYSFNSLQASNTYNYYRFIVSNCSSAGGTLNIGNIKILDSSGFMIHSFTNASTPQVINPNVFGGKSTPLETMTLNLSSASDVSTVTIDTPSYGEYPSNVSVYNLLTGSLIRDIYPVAYNGATVTYNAQSVTQLSNINFRYNSINYNPSGRSRAFISNFKIYNNQSIQIVPTFTSNTSTSVSQPKQNLEYGQTDIYSCSNIFPFDDDANTAWYSTAFKATDGTCQLATSPGFTFKFPKAVTVRGFKLTNSTVKEVSINLSGTTPASSVLLPNNSQYYQLTAPLAGTTFACNVLSTLPGMNTCSIGGLTLYGNTTPSSNLIRLTPTMTSPSATLTQTSIMAYGRESLGSNESVTIRFYKPISMNSYSITTSPPLSSWNVYSDTTLIENRLNVNDGNETINSQFTTTNVSNLRIEVYATQSTFTNFATTIGPLSVKHLQLYTNTGVPLIPTMTSNNTYKSNTYSSEIPGQYTVSASSLREDVVYAFDGLNSTTYSSLGNFPTSDTLNLGSTGFTLFYSNNVVSNCTDFRNLQQATKGLVSLGAGVQCTWLGYFTNPPSITTTGSGISTSSSGNNRTITYDGSTNFTSVQFGSSLSYMTNVWSTSTTMGDWIQIQLPTIVFINGILVSGQSMDTCSLFGSLNEVSWTQISPTIPINRVIDLTNTTSYKYYRLVSTQFTQINDIALYNNNGRINSYLY